MIMESNHEERNEIYRMEELIPIVGRLAEKYTGFESSSITYEKAGQLMEAVLYCIHETKGWDSEALSAAEGEHDSRSRSFIRSLCGFGDGDFPEGGMTAKRAYEVGLMLVERKVKSALEHYNEMLPHFVSYENHCLNDTFIKGLPEFFKWYDMKFDPQSTILSLDYPVLKDLSEYRGIDRIYGFLSCVRLEQTFLLKFPVDYVMGVLERRDVFFRDMVENIGGMVLETVLIHILGAKPLTEQDLGEEAYFRIREVVAQGDLEEVRRGFQKAAEAFFQDNYENSEALGEYFMSVVDGLAVRLKAAYDQGTLGQVICMF